MADDDDEQIVEIVSSRVLGSARLGSARLGSAWLGLAWLWLGSTLLGFARLWLGLSQFIAQLCFVGTKNDLLFLFRI